MKVIVFRDERNLNLIKNAHWEFFANRIRKIFENVLNEKIVSASVSLDNDGKKVGMLFYLKEHESLTTLKLRFEDFLCKAIVYDEDGKKKHYQTYKIELLWHKFLVECFGDKVLDELYDFYKKSNRNFQELKDFVKKTEGF